MKITYNQLLEDMYNRGANCADIALGRMMDMVEDETGEWPSWDDAAPQWVIDNCC